MTRALLGHAFPLLSSALKRHRKLDAQSSSLAVTVAGDEQLIVQMTTSRLPHECDNKLLKMAVKVCETMALIRSESKLTSDLARLSRE